MVKTTVLLTLLVLSGCATTPPPIEFKTETQEVLVPLMYCPAPAKIERPILPIHTMTPDQINSAGEIVKHYKATILSLIGYSRELEYSLDKYNTISKDLTIERKKLETKYGKEVILPNTQPRIR